MGPHEGGNRVRVRPVAIAATLAFIISACTGGAQPAPSASAPAAAPAATATEPTTPVTLHMFIRNYMLNQDPPLKTAKVELEKKHPNVTIDLSPAPYDEQHQRILLSKAGGGQPDMLP